MNDVEKSYAILNISLMASPEVAKQAYRKLAKIWHPDRYINDPLLKAKAEVEIKKINRAYGVVKDHQEKNGNNIVRQKTPKYSSSQKYPTTVAKTQSTPEFYYQQGMDYLEAKDYDAALNSFAQAIKLNPNYLQAYQCRGFILSKLGYDLRANAEFKKADNIKLKSKVAQSYGKQYTPQSNTNKHSTVGNKTTSHPLEFWKTIAGFKQPFKHLAISYQGHLATAGNGNKIDLWKMDTEERIDSFKGHTDEVTCLGISSNGRTLISGSQDKAIRFWDLEKGKIIRTFGGYFDGHLSKVIALALTGDNQTLISCGGDNSMKIWSISQAMEVENIFSSAAITSLAISPDGQLFCSGSLELQLQIRNTKTGQVIRSINNSSGVLSLAFSPDSNLLATANFNSNIKLWDITTGQEIYTLTGHSERVLKVVFSSNGKTLISSSWDGSIKLWKLATGGLITSIEAHSDRILDLAIAPNQEILASSSEDKTVKLWRCNL